MLWATRNLPILGIRGSKIPLFYNLILSICIFSTSIEPIWFDSEKKRNGIKTLPRLNFLPSLGNFFCSLFLTFSVFSDFFFHVFRFFFKKRWNEMKYLPMLGYYRASGQYLYRHSEIFRASEQNFAGAYNELLQVVFSPRSSWARMASAAWTTSTRPRRAWQSSTWCRDRNYKTLFALNRRLICK